VQINNKLVVEVDVKFYDGKTKDKVICHIHLKKFNLTEGEPKCEENGVTVVTNSAGTQSTFNINYPAANFLTSIQEIANGPTSSYYNIYVWQPQSLVEQSTGICVAGDTACSVKALETNKLDWEPVRSSSQRQFITNNQAQTICNNYVDAFFIKSRRAPYQRDAKMNNIIANVLAGCVDDLVFTGQIEMARAGLDVLMMQELINDATSIHSIQTAVQSGMKAARVILNDAAKMAEVESRQIL